MNEIEKKSKAEIKTLQDKIASQLSTISQYENLLQSSRKREEEIKLSLHNLLKERVLQETQQKNMANNMEEGEEIDETNENNQTNKNMKQFELTYLTLIEKCKQKEIDYEKEFNDTKKNMNDLMLEIECVAMDEEKTREQNKKLLIQINDNIIMEKKILEENLRLQQDIDSLKRKYSDIETR